MQQTSLWSFSFFFQRESVQYVHILFSIILYVSIFFENFLNYASVAQLKKEPFIGRFAGQAQEFKSKIYILNLSTSLCDGSASKSRQVYLQLTYYPPLQPPVNAIRQIYLQRISLYNNGNSCLPINGLFELFQLVKIEDLTFCSESAYVFLNSYKLTKDRFQNYYNLIFHVT